MKWAITEKFHHYLLGGHFTVITDNNLLTYFCSAKWGALEQRRASQLAQFNFEIKYQLGKVNPADALSHMPFDSLPESPVTEVLPEVTSVHDTWCEQSAVDSSPCVDVSGVTNSSVQPADKAEETDKAATTESSQVVHSQPAWTTKYKHWIHSLVLSLQHSQLNPQSVRNVLCECWCNSIHICSWGTGFSIADKQTSDMVSSSSWFCPVPFHLMS